MKKKKSHLVETSLPVADIANQGTAQGLAHNGGQLDHPVASNGHQNVWDDVSRSRPIELQHVHHIPQGRGAFPFHGDHRHVEG